VVDDRRVVAVFALSMLLIPSIGAEFMPKLDEGALWVRATMPYTISFEESSKIVPQVRDILRSFPEVTVVASEHGVLTTARIRPASSTPSSTSGSSRTASGTARIDTKPQLIAAVGDKLKVFPGITFNFTQPPRTRSTRRRRGSRARST
jgi:cobalt-zinc-cadmium resistance protein CzcA